MVWGGRREEGSGWGTHEIIIIIIIIPISFTIKYQNVKKKKKKEPPLEEMLLSLFNILAFSPTKNFSLRFELADF